MGGVIHRAIDTLDPTAALGECIDQEHLRDLVAGQTIGSRDHHAFNRRQGNAVAEAIQPRTLEGGPALAVIAGEMLLGDMPVRGCRAVGMQAAARWFTRLLWWLTAR